MRWQRRCFLFALYGLCVVTGLVLGHDSGFLEDHVYPGNEVNLHRVIAMGIILYILFAALPFVPGAEIGLGLMLIFGPNVAVLVYMSTIFALTVSYLVGRAVPARVCAAAFESFGFRKARKLILEMDGRDANVRLALLLTHAPARIVPGLLRHRYLALAMALNLPGNTLVGGGGGIALSAGMSGLYPLPAYLATIAVATAPVPLLFAFSALLP